MKTKFTSACYVLFFMITLSCSQDKKQTESSTDQTNNKVEASAEAEPDISNHETLKNDLDKKPPTDINALATRQILSGKVQASIPQAFKAMTPQMIAIKYPTKVDMEYDAFTNLEGNINIAFEHMPNPGGEQDLPEIQSVMSQQFNHPDIKVQKNEIIKINGKDFVVFEMVTPAPDSRIYNLMFVTSLDNRYLMGNFNCTVNHQSEWQPIANKILHSIEINGGKSL